MLKAIEQLVRGERMSVGNHRCRSYSEGNHQKEDYIYHCTAICKVDHTTHTFIIDKGEYSDKMSTNRAVKDYREYFNSKGYEEVFKYFYQLIDVIVNMPMDSMRKYFYGDFNNPPIAITVKKRMLGTEKFVEINVAKQSETYTHSYEIKYKGPKTLEKQAKDCMHELFPL